MRIISSNSCLLLKCSIATSVLCEFCTMVIESINYLFCECLYVHQFWTETSNCLKDYNEDISFSLKTVFFGEAQQINNPNTQVKNFIIRLAKYFIFRSICSKSSSKPHFLSFHLLVPCLSYLFLFFEILFVVTLQNIIFEI